MRNISISRDCFLLLLFFLTACKSAVKEQEDKIYSRHLQRHVELTIISTRIPDEKSETNLLLFNNGNDLEKTGAKQIIDSLFSKNLIQPLVLVGIHGNEAEEYGLSNLESPGNKGNKAGKYNSFVINELYPFIKKKTVIRKFRSIAICGYSLAGISAFDVDWENADKIDKVGIFSGDLNYAGQPDPGNNNSINPVLQKIQASRKRPKLQYWLYAGETGDTSFVSNTKDLINIINNKNTGVVAGIQFISDKTGSNDLISWKHHFAEFLVWAFGK